MSGKNRRVIRRLVSPEPVHLLHVVQRDHAVAQDNVQEAVGAEQQLAAEVLPVQLRHFHQHPHSPGVHLVGVFPTETQSASSRTEETRSAGKVTQRHGIEKKKKMLTRHTELNPTFNGFNRFLVWSRLV